MAAVDDVLGIYTMIPDSRIGSGAQGWIERATRDGVMYAVKFSKGYISSINEYFTTREFDGHPHIIQAYSLYPKIVRVSPFTKKEETVTAMVMEYANHGDLFKYAAKGVFGCPKLTAKVRDVKLTESYARILFSELVKAVETCHTKRICHLDIKLENLLLKDWSLKLADFGLSRKCDDSGHIEKITGATYSYSPPEFFIRNLDGTYKIDPKGARVMNEDGTYDAYIINSDDTYTYDGTKVDIFNMGIVLFILLTGFPPLDNALYPGDWYYTRILKGDFESFWNGIEKTVWISPSAKRLLTGMLWPLYEERYTIDDIKASEWFKTENAKDTEEKEDARSSLIKKLESTELDPVNLKSQFDAVAGQGRKSKRHLCRRKGKKRSCRRKGKKHLCIPKLVRH